MTNRIPFDLEKALAGHPVVTRDGRDVIDLKWWNAPKILEVCIQNTIGSFTLTTFKENGFFYDNNSASHSDLFMKPKRKTLWIAVAKDQSYIGRYDSVGAFADKDELIRIIRDWPNLSNYSIISVEIEV